MWKIWKRRNRKWFNNLWQDAHFFPTFSHDICFRVLIYQTSNKPSDLPLPACQQIHINSTAIIVDASFDQSSFTSILAVVCYSNGIWLSYILLKTICMDANHADVKAIQLALNWAHLSNFENFYIYSDFKVTCVTWTSPQPLGDIYLNACELCWSSMQWKVTLFLLKVLREQTRRVAHDLALQGWSLSMEFNA